MTSLSTHVLDAVTGSPATGLALLVTAADGTPVAAGTTDADGRARLAEDLAPGTYRLLLSPFAYSTYRGS